MIFDKVLRPLQITQEEHDIARLNILDALNIDGGWVEVSDLARRAGVSEQVLEFVIATDWLQGNVSRTPYDPASCSWSYKINLEPGEMSGIRFAMSARRYHGVSV